MTKSSDSIEDRLVWRCVNLPPRVAMPALRALSTLSWMLTASSGKRARVRKRFENYQLIAGDNRPAGAIAREYFARRLLCRVGAGMAAYHRDPMLEGLLTVSGEEHVAAALSAGKGCFLTSAHLGAPGLPAAFLQRRGMTVTSLRRGELTKAPADSIHSKLAFFGVEPMFVGWEAAPAAPLKKAMQLVTANGIVMYLIDGHFGTRSVTTTLFGRPFDFRTGFAEVARLTGTPLILSFGLVEKRRLHIKFYPPVTVATPEDVQAFIETAGGEIEREIRREPASIHWQRMARELFAPDGCDTDRQSRP